MRKLNSINSNCKLVRTNTNVPREENYTGDILVIMFVINYILNETLTVIRNFEVNIVYYISYNNEYD